MIANSNLTKDLFKDLKSPKTPISEVWNIRFSDVQPEWNQRYRSVRSGKSLYVRPDRAFYGLNVNLYDQNPLNLTHMSSGIYAIFENSRCIYVGKTQMNIAQRFDAHISKISAINNNKYHHPQNWQKYAVSRYRRNCDSSDLSDIFVKFYPLADWSEIFCNVNDDEVIDHMEAMIFYAKKYISSDYCMLNHEPSVGVKNARQKWRSFFSSLDE